MAVGGQTTNSSAYALTVGGIDYTTWTDVGQTFWSESGTEAAAQFECVIGSNEVSTKTLTAGYDFTGQEVALQDLTNSRKLFGGFVTNARRFHGVGPVVYYALKAVSFDALLDRTLVPKWRSTLDGTTNTKLILSDRAMVQKVIGTFGYDLTANNTNVANTNADMPRIILNSVTVRDILQAIADNAAWPASPQARRFYVDFNKQVHYFKGNEGTSAPYKIGNALFDGTYIIPDSIEYEKDVTDAAKSVYIKGGNKYGTGLVSNIYGGGRPYDRVDMIDVPESDSTRAKTDIAASYFNREGAPTTGGRFTITGKDGWRANQTLHVKDTALGLDDDFQIREIQAVPNMGSGITTYDIAFGTVPWRATYMLNRKKRAGSGRGNPPAPVPSDVPAADDNRTPDPGGGGCFVSGTLVSTPTGDWPIEDLFIGDRVLAFDGKALVPSLVTAVLKHPQHTEPRILVTLEDDSQLEVTVGHRFYDPNLSDYRAIGEFKIGEPVFDPLTGQLKIASIAWLGDDPTDVYNLTVETHHNYLVEGVLVHNSKTP